MRKMKRVAAYGLSVLLAMGTIACAGNTEKTEENKSAVENNAETSVEHPVHKIGVAIYSEEDDEVNMFRDYYRNYLEVNFPVEFVYSTAISDLDEEKAFVDSAKEAGCEGIISYTTRDLDDIVSYCGEDFYYVYASGSFSEADIEAASQYENFLGVIGPSEEDEKAAGYNMIKSLGDEGKNKTYILMSGGASLNNYMHYVRTLGMLEALEKEYGFNFNASLENLANVSDNTDCVASTADGGQIYICPGYMSASTENFEKMISELEPDVITSACNGAPVAQFILDREKEINKDIKVGVVDCFCESNQQNFTKTDIFGDTELNYLSGKCAANGCAAFVAMYNAVTGHKDANSDNGKAFHLNQKFWTATDTESYNELSAMAENIYNNVYTTQDIMKVLAEYTPETSYEDYVNFVDELNQY